MTVTIKNTANNYSENISGVYAFIGSMLTGPAYFFAKGVYGWGFIATFIVSALLWAIVFSNAEWIAPIFIAHFIISLSSGAAVHTHYMRLGWVVSEEPE